MSKSTRSAVRPDYLPDLRKGSPDAPLYVSQLCAARNPPPDLLDEVQRDLPAATTEASAMIRSLWFITGFLTGVVSTGLGFLWMMTMAVVA